MEKDSDTSKAESLPSSAITCQRQSSVPFASSLTAAKSKLSSKESPHSPSVDPARTKDPSSPAAAWVNTSYPSVPSCGIVEWGHGSRATAATCVILSAEVQNETWSHRSCVVVNVHTVEEIEQRV